MAQLPASRKAAGCSFELLVGVVVVAADSRLFEGAVHPLDLAVGPGAVEPDRCWGMSGNRAPSSVGASSSAVGAGERGAFGPMSGALDRRVAARMACVVVALP